MNQGTSIVCSERASLRAHAFGVAGSVLAPFQAGHPMLKISSQTFIVPRNAAGTRLDIWLTQQAITCQAIALSRARLQALIHDGHVTINGG